MVVDLPAPFGPRKPCTSPELTERSSPSRARVGPNILTRPDVEITGVMTLTLQCLQNIVKLRNHMDSVFLAVTDDEYQYTQ